MTVNNGWNESAAAWIEGIGDEGDFVRTFVLDPAIEQLLSGRRFSTALDVGCGEGRFCRKFLDVYGIPSVTGLDATPALIEEARKRDSRGAYVLGDAAALPFDDEQFDLVLTYLSLIDIGQLDEAIAEMARVLKGGGSLIIANLNGFTTAATGKRWVTDDNGRRLHFRLDDYLEEHSSWEEWKGIRILNYHRPMSRYMSRLLECGLTLVRFEEPPAVGGPADRQDAYRRVPYAHLMEWRKPAL